MVVEEFKNKVENDGHNFVFIAGKYVCDLVQIAVAESGYGAAPIKYQFDDSLSEGLSRFYKQVTQNPSLFFETSIVLSIAEMSDRRLIREWAKRLSECAEKNAIKPRINLLILQPQKQGTRKLKTSPCSKYLKQLTMRGQSSDSDQNLNYGFVDFVYNVNVNDNVAQAKNRISARLQLALSA